MEVGPSSKVERGDAIRVLRGLAPYLRPHARTLAWAASLLIVTTLLQLAGPLLVRHAIDSDIPTGDARGLAFTALAFLACLALHLALNVTLRVRVEVVGQAVILRLRQLLFGHLVRQSLSFHDRMPPGRLIARVQGDTEAMRQLFASSVVTLVAAAALFLGMMAVLSWAEPRFALIALVMVLIVLAASAVLVLRGLPWQRRHRERAADLSSHVAERVHGLAAVQAFGREAGAVAEVDDLGRAKRAAQWRAWSFEMGPHQIQGLVDVLAVAAAVYLGGLWVLDGTATLGTVVLALDYLRRLHDPIAHAAEQLGTLQRAVVAGSRVLGLLDEPLGVRDPKDPVRWEGLTHGIELRDVSFSYRGDAEQAVRDVSFTLPKGQTWAVVGATGSGKTTLLNLILRFHDPQQGSVLVDGIDVRRIPQSDLRGRMALVLQDVHVFAGDVLHNVSPSGEVESDEEAARLRALGGVAGLDPVVARLPGGWSAPVAERGANLSLGERQLLALARALARDPDVLLLDEATASIDPRTEAQVQASIAKLLRGRTALVIAHRLTTVRDADGILVMQGGRIVERGTHDELLAMGGVYADLHALHEAGRVGQAGGGEAA